MAQLSAEQLEAGVIAASAGNHAQGVALAAKALGTHARIFMPRSTPRMKREAVLRHGGDAVEISLTGANFQESQDAARLEVEGSQRSFVHAFDDMDVMAGQGTMADEVVMAAGGPIDAAFLQVGGGGMAAGVATWLKNYWPGIHIVGVEGVDQASMHAALAAGEPVVVPNCDVFCDGTAVGKAGQHTMPLCRDLVDSWMTVTNAEVSAAIQRLWETRRCIPEPSGAMGLAGLAKDRDRWQGKRVLSIICGSNMDFGQLATIARDAEIGAARRRFFRLQIGERPGTMCHLLESFPENRNIVGLLYGKVHGEQAWPVVGVDGSPMELDAVEYYLKKAGFQPEDVSQTADVSFRLVPFNPELCQNPFFIELDFHEASGALKHFLELLPEAVNICYFNYSYSGERVGRALLGFESANPAAIETLKSKLEQGGRTFRGYREVCNASALKP